MTVLPTIYIIAASGDSMVFKNNIIMDEVLTECALLTKEYVKNFYRYKVLLYQNQQQLKSKYMDTALKTAFRLYTYASKEELTLYHFIIKNNLKINLDNLYKILSDLNHDSTSKKQYIETVFGNFSSSLIEQKMETFNISLVGVSFLTSMKRKIYEQQLKENKDNSFLKQPGRMKHYQKKNNKY